MYTYLPFYLGKPALTSLSFWYRYTQYFLRNIFYQYSYDVIKTKHKTKQNQKPFVILFIPRVSSGLVVLSKKTKLNVFPFFSLKETDFP